MRLLDLFCGRWGWSRAFAARGWECVGVDWVQPTEIPQGCEFLCMDILDIAPDKWLPKGPFDFIVASPPCQEFSVWGMPHFHPNPKYPETGILLFNHTREVCKASGVPYVIENVRPAQSFVGLAKHHCGPFYLWGTGVPPLMHKGITKGWGSKWIDSQGRMRDQGPTGRAGGKAVRGEVGVLTAIAATIPPELANCVAEYAERILEQKEVVSAAPATSGEEEGK